MPDRLLPKMSNDLILIFVIEEGKHILLNKVHVSSCDRVIMFYCKSKNKHFPIMTQITLIFSQLWAYL